MFEIIIAALLGALIVTPVILVQLINGEIL